MLKTAPVIAACALVVSAFAIAVTGPAATAAAAKCLTKANRIVACTDKFKAKTQRQSARDHLLWIGGIEGDSIEKARRGPRLRAR